MNSFEAANSVFIITNENKTFPFTISGYWTPEDGEEFLNKLLKPRSNDDIEILVKELEKRGTRIKLENSGYELEGFDHFESEILTELERVRYRDLEDMVYRMELSYDEIVDILDVKYIAGSTTGYTLPPSIYKITVII